MQADKDERKNGNVQFTIVASANLPMGTPLKKLGKLVTYQWLLFDSIFFIAELALRSSLAKVVVDHLSLRALSAYEPI